jgi:hypothetical protein
MERWLKEIPLYGKNRVKPKTAYFFLYKRDLMATREGVAIKLKQTLCKVF